MASGEGDKAGHSFGTNLLLAVLSAPVAWPQKAGMEGSLTSSRRARPRIDGQMVVARGLTHVGAMAVAIAGLLAVGGLGSVVPGALVALGLGNVTALMATWSFRLSRRRQTTMAASAAFGWSLVPAALTVGTGAAVIGASGFLPTLILVWSVYALVGGLLLASTGVVSLAVGGTMVASTLGFLYGQPPLAVWGAVAVGAWCVLRWHRGPGLVVVVTLAGATAAQLSAYDLLEPSRNPVSYSQAQLTFFLPLFATVIGLWSGAARRDAHVWLADVVRVLHRVLIFMIYFTFSLPVAWKAVDRSLAVAGTNQAALALCLAIFVGGATAMVRLRVPGASWWRFALWWGAFLAVGASNLGVDSRVLGAVAAVFAAGMALARLRGPGMLSVIAGAFMLVTVVTVVVLGQRLPIPAAILVLLPVAMTLIRQAKRWRPSPHPMSAHRERRYAARQPMEPGSAAGEAGAGAPESAGPGDIFMRVTS